MTHQRSLTLIARSALLFAFLLFPFGFANAQSATATLSGTVTDQNGAVVPGATVTVLNPATSLERQATTNGEGDFVIPLLPPGRYTVRAEHEGFAILEARDVVLNVGDNKSLQMPLKAGKISEMVQITGDAPLINESPAVGTVVDRQFVGNLPLNGRSFNSLIALTPGVVQTKAGFSSPGQFSVNGQRPNANYFTVDGVSANIGTTSTLNLAQTPGGALPGLTALGGTNNLVSIDALQEFKVLTSSYAPEFGRTPGGQVLLVTRSGSNDFHGSLFNYLRNDVFDSNDWFANRAGLERPALRQNDFGGTFSGPILLPRFGEGGKQPWYNGRNKTFFFFSYEGLRLRQPKVVSNAEVPSISLRQSALAQIQPYLNAFPIPNGPDLGNGLALFSASYSAPSTLDATSIRIDHVINDRATLFVRYNDAPSETISRSSFRLSSPFSTQVDTRTLTGVTTFSITPNISNDFRVNYSKTRAQARNFLDNFGGAVPLSDSQFFPPFATSQASQVVFGVNFSTAPQLSVGSNSENFQRQFNIVDTLSVIADNHQLKFGVDYRRLSPIFGPTNYFQQAAFNNATALRTATASLVVTSARLGARPLFTNFSAFVQDTWKVIPRLTLTYGLRWEVNPPPIAADGNDAFTATGLDNPATIALAPRGTPLYKTTYNNFAPRFGVAYQLSKKPGRETALRGGIGIFYDLGTGPAARGFSSFPFATNNLITANVPYPVTGSATAPPPFPTPPFSFVVAFDPNLKLPRTYQWNLAIERSLGNNQTVSASYLGAIGRRLINAETITNPNPTFSSVGILRNKATSDYHAMQLQFQRRLSQGLQALASYTWSHSIDAVSSDFGLGLDRGSSDFDVRHSFSAAVTYNLPTPKVGKLSEAILGGWAIDGIIRSQSATPVDLIARTTINVAGQSIPQRPDLIPGIPLYIEDPTAPGGRKFNNTVDPARPGCKGPFCPPPTTRQGTLGRNVLRGFPLNQVDLSLRRRFDLTERVNLQVRADVFNIFNHPNFADPNNTLTSATFGLSNGMFGSGLGGGVAGGFNPLYQIGGARSMQFSLKLQF
jgi:outer membrane receptor protein involved in Fe transport